MQVTTTPSSRDTSPGAALISYFVVVSFADTVTVTPAAVADAVCVGRSFVQSHVSKFGNVWFGGEKRGSGRSMSMLASAMSTSCAGRLGPPPPPAAGPVDVYNVGPATRAPVEVSKQDRQTCVPTGRS